MNIIEASKKGYRVVKASDFEVGLTKNGRGIRTWFSQRFNGRLPNLAHPEIQRCIKNHEKLIEEGLV